MPTPHAIQRLWDKAGTPCPPVTTMCPSRELGRPPPATLKERLREQSQKSPEKAPEEASKKAPEEASKKAPEEASKKAPEEASKSPDEVVKNQEKVIEALNKAVDAQSQAIVAQGRALEAQNSVPQTIVVSPSAPTPDTSTAGVSGGGGGGGGTMGRVSGSTGSGATDLKSRLLGSLGGASETTPTGTVLGATGFDSKGGTVTGPVLDEYAGEVSTGEAAPKEGEAALKEGEVSDGGDAMAGQTSPFADAGSADAGSADSGAMTSSPSAFEAAMRDRGTTPLSRPIFVQSVFGIEYPGWFKLWFHQGFNQGALVGARHCLMLREGRTVPSEDTVPPAPLRVGATYDPDHVAAFREGFEEGHRTALGAGCGAVLDALLAKVRSGSDRFGT